MEAYYKPCGHLVCGGARPSQEIINAIKTGRIYDPLRGIPGGLIRRTVPHPRWGTGEQAIGWERCSLGRTAPYLDRA